MCVCRALRLLGGVYRAEVPISIELQGIKVLLRVPAMFLQGFCRVLAFFKAFYTRRFAGFVLTVFWA